MAKERRGADFGSGLAAVRGDTPGLIPSFHVVAKSLPESYWRVMNVVHELGYELRTQYDRKNSDGTFLDPLGRDAKVSVEIMSPFSQPRFPALSYCERGKYIAEFLGAKDHLVVPYDELLEAVSSGKEEFEATQWPYCYHQRLTAHPRGEGKTVDQLEVCIDKLVKDPITRRAVAQTGVPEIDLFMAADMPCLREIQLRAIENQRGSLMLNMHAVWRSRDLYKAWGDNVIGITNLQERLAARLAEKTGRKVISGSYTETNGSLHIYGQDYLDKGAGQFFDNFPTVESFVEASTTSEDARGLEVIPQLEELKGEETWRFPPEAIVLIDKIIEDFKIGRFVP